MVKHNLMKLLRDPLGVAKREFRRLLRKYEYQNTYIEDSEGYWADRLGKYGFDLRGVGDEGLSHEENERIYLQAKDTFMSLCNNENINFTKIRILDVGCGIGFYAKIFFENGGKHYLGIDITDTLFNGLEKKFPGFKFCKLDITGQQLDGIFDLITMIDVTQHITDTKKFSFAMQNIKSHLSENGIFIVTSWLSEDARISYYEASRSLDTYNREFPDFVFTTPLSFRGKFIFAIKKKA